MPERPGDRLGRLRQIAGFGGRLPLIELTARTGRAFNRPISMGLMLGNGCNLRCRHCFFVPESGARWMEYEPAAEALRQAAEAGVKQLTLTGGEPLLFPDLGRVVRLGKELGMIVGFPTNGVLLDDETCLGLIDAGADRISVSLDGSRPEINDRLRGSGAWTAASAGLDSLIRAADRTGARIEIRINTVVVEHNIDDLGAMHELALDRGAELNLMPFHVEDLSHVGTADARAEAVREHWPGPEAVERLRSETVPALIRARRRRGGLLNPESHLRLFADYYAHGRVRRKCLFGAYHISVGVDGLIGLCIPEIGAAGNIKTTTIKQAWSSRAMAVIRSRMRHCDRCMLNCSYLPTAAEVVGDQFRPGPRAAGL